jgi:hypothetical protein
VVFAAAAVLGACGNSSSSGGNDADIDAPELGDGDLDMGDSGPIVLTCDFTEAADSTNDLLSMAEATGKTLGTRITVCGEIDNGHFDAGSGRVDADGFEFTIGTDTDVLVHILGTGIAMPDDTVIQLFENTTFVAFGVVEGDHGTMAAHLPAGDYRVAMASFDSADISAPIAYQLTIVPDTPATRCPAATTGGFAEAGDGGSNNGNDVVDYESSSNTPSSLSASGTDVPEATGITADPAMQYRVTGSSADVNPADDYEDRDTFAFTTGASTTQMTIRLNWASTSMDLDYRVYPAIGSGDPLSIVGGLDESPMEEEFETFAVKPSTTYWLWIAAEDGATGQPSPYAATLCGEQFSP